MKAGKLRVLDPENYHSGLRDGGWSGEAHASGGFTAFGVFVTESGNGKHAKTRAPGGSSSF